MSLSVRENYAIRGREACGNRVPCVRYVKGIILALQSCKDEGK
jgi:hypothetical protein